MQAQEK